MHFETHGSSSVVDQVPADCERSGARAPSHVRMRPSGQQAAAPRLVHGLGAGGRPELAEQVATVRLDGRLGDPEAAGDLLEAQALLERVEQLALATVSRGPSAGGASGRSVRPLRTAASATGMWATASRRAR